MSDPTRAHPPEPGPHGGGTTTSTDHLRPDSIRPDRREISPDVTRSLALLGVIIMNYHGYMILRGAPRRDGTLSELFDPWTGVFSTRFAATFVLVAGAGVTLMTRSALGDPERVRALRWRLASRGLVLYVFGLGFDLIWRGSILSYYGAMFAVGALLFTLRTRWLVLIGTSAALAAWGLAWWILERRLGGHDVSWLTDPGPDSVRGLVFDVAVNGTHPLLPWLAFFCAGMVTARFLAHRWMTAITAMLGVAFATVAALGRTIAHDGAWAAVDGTVPPRIAVLFSTDPFDRGLLYTLSALGTAMVGFAVVTEIVRRVGRPAVIDVLARAGQVSLTVYVLHALVFNLLVDVWGWVTPDGVGTALVFAVLVWGVGTVWAAWWQLRWVRGPFEQVYRSITR